MKTRTLVIGGAGLILLGWLFLEIAQGNRIEQPIAFNHKKHVQNHVPCAVCHPLYKKYARAGIPGVRICVRCHEDVIYRNKEKDKIQKYYTSNQQIPWQRVYRVKPHVYFSHRRHVAIAKLACSECHGKVQQLEKPITTQALKIKMKNCLNCHEKQNASVDCVDCHR